MARTAFEGPSVFDPVADGFGIVVEFFLVAVVLGSIHFVLLMMVVIPVGGALRREALRREIEKRRRFPAGEFFEIPLF